MEFRITLDREAFKVLASDTRLDILKALDARSMTVSELGRKLELNKATVFEHLEKLVQAGLVKKHDDEGRKWVYYTLSWKGRRILHPERITISLMLSSALGALLSGAVVAAEYLRLAGRQTSGPGEAGGEAGARQAAPSLAPPPADAAPAAAADPTLLYAAVVLLVAVAILVLAALWSWRHARARDRVEAAEAARRAASRSAPPPGS